MQLATYRLAILLNRNLEFDARSRIAGCGSARAGRAGNPVRARDFAAPYSSAARQVETSKSNLVRAAGDIAPLLQDSKYDEAFPRFQSLLRQYPTSPFLH